MPLTPTRVLLHPPKRYALYSRGEEDLVVVPMSQSLRFTTELTLEFWMYFPQDMGGDYDRSVEVVGALYDYWVRYNQFYDPNLWELIIYDTEDTQRILGNLRINLTAGWYQIAVTWKSGVGGAFYLNGVNRAGLSSASYIMRQTASNFVVRWRYVPCYFAMVRAYDRLLSDREMRYNFENPMSPITNGLRLWLKMEEGSGTTVYDYSGYGNHGTIYNATWAEITKTPVRTLSPVRVLSPVR